MDMAVADMDMDAGTLAGIVAATEHAADMRVV
jgi:hypothetical protein